MASKKPVRTQHETLYARLSPEDAERARSRAAHFGMTMADYLTALVRGDEPFPIPASHIRMGGCIVDAIAVLRQTEPDVEGAIRLLREAQRLGVEFERAFLPAFDGSHAADEAEQSTDARR
jgi:Flp pilus assembly protein TadB